MGPQPVVVSQHWIGFFSDDRNMILVIAKYFNSSATLFERRHRKLATVYVVSIPETMALGRATF